MNKSGKIICGIVVAILIAVVVIVMVVFSSLKIFGEIKNLSKYSPDTIVKQENEKLLALHWGEGFGDGSKKYEIEIYEDGKEIYSFTDFWDKEANENFFNIAKKVKEIKDICEGK